MDRAGTGPIHHTSELYHAKVTTAMTMKTARGFTLIELMVSTAIAIGIGAVLTMTLKMSQQSWEVSDAYLTSSLQLRLAAETLSHDLVAAKNTTLSIPADGTWYNTISFQVPMDTDGNGVVVDGGGALELSPVLSFFLGGTSGSQVIRTVNGTPNRVVANGVSVLRFRRQAATSQVVEINLTVQRGLGDFKNTASFTTQVRVRN